MRRLYLVFILPVCALLVFEAMPILASGPDHPAAATPATAGKTEIVTDEKAHVVRILIDGKEVVAIDATGLRVKGDVAYSGVITDTGGADPVR
jgi:hypothetical protein